MSRIDIQSMFCVAYHLGGLGKIVDQHRTLKLLGTPYRDLHNRKKKQPSLQVPTMSIFGGDQGSNRDK